MERATVERTVIQKQLIDTLMGLQVPREDATFVADTLLDAESSGVESHGLMRLKPYADRLEQGLINPTPGMKLNGNGAVAKLDGDNGLGPVVMKKAVETAQDLAKKYGIGAVAVSHSNHFGMASVYTNRLAAEDCIGFVASTAGPTMAPFGGLDLLLGTNPFSVAFPGQSQSFCADMATSATAKGKIRVYEKKGQPIPLGWALNQEGNDTTDPAAAIRGILLPMGGHKGYALAMAVEAVGALLSGASLSCESVSVFSADQQANTGHFVVAVDIAHFLPVEEFTARAQAWFDKIKSSRPRSGYTIMIPGEPEQVRRKETEETLSILPETAQMIETYWKRFAAEKTDQLN